MAHYLLSWESKILKRLRSLKPAYYIILAGLLLFAFGFVNYYNARILSFKSVPGSAAIAGGDTPIEIIIPSLNLGLGVEPAEIKNGVWAISPDQASYLITSAEPGTGNTVIYGHNKKRIFGSLPYLSIGQKIIVKTKSGKIFTYIADKKYFVDPDRVDLVSPKSENVLTLYTCFGLFDGKRAVIVAKPSI